MPRVERLDEALDRASFSAGVAALEHEQQTGAELARIHLAAHVQAQLQQPPLGRGQSLVVLLAGEALGEIQRVEASHRRRDYAVRPHAAE